MNDKTIGKRISKARNELGMSVEQVSADTGIDSALLLEYEAGAKKLNEQDGIVLATYWKLDPFVFGIELPLPKTMPKSFLDLVRGNKKQKYTQVLNLWEKTLSKAFQKRSKAEMTSAFQNQLFQPKLMKDESPFLFMRIAIILAIIYGLAYLITDVTIANLTLSMIVPFSMMWCLYERHLPRTLSGLDLIGYFFIGGLASIFTVFLIYEVVASPDILFVHDIVTGLVEESAKVFIVIAIIRKRKLEHVLSGMLVGFAVGAGFDVFETARYGISALIDTVDFGSMQFLVFRRSIYALIGAGHHFWTGMLTGVLVSVSSTGYLKLKDLFKPIFLIWFGIMALTHAIFNFSTNFPFTSYVVSVGSLFLFVSMWSKAVHDYEQSIIPVVEVPVTPELIADPLAAEPVEEVSIDNTTEVLN